MKPQGLDLNEHGIESGVTAPQARNFAFLGHKGVKISLLFSIFYLPGTCRDFRFTVFFLGGGAKDMLAPPSRPLGRGHGRVGPPLDPPVVRSGKQKRPCIKAHLLKKKMTDWTL